MKKISLVIAAAHCGVAFYTLTAFDGPASPELQKQLDGIKAAVDTKVSDFTAQKEAECQAIALEKAAVKADSIMLAAKGKKGIIAPKPKTKTKKSVKPTTTTAPPTTTTTGPQQPTRVEGNNGKKGGGEEAVNTGKKGAEEAKSATDPTQGVNKGKKKG